MKIDILIPTYQRTKSLIQNLAHLLARLDEEEVVDYFQILISDNASKDSTREDVLQFIVENRCENLIAYSCNDENIGLEGNAVKVASSSTSDYVMWCGDDDYVAPGYLRFVVDQLQDNPDLGCIIPGLGNLSQDGSFEEGRIEAFDNKALPKGFSSTYQYSHLAHQMSGIVFKKDGLLEDYLAQPPYRNPYLFIYFTANRLLQFNCLYAPSFKTRITVFNDKDWSYNDVGLLDEVFKNYYALSLMLSQEQLDDLLIRFVVSHSYRLAFRPLRFNLLLKQYVHLVSLSNYSLRYRLLITKVFCSELLSLQISKWRNKGNATTDNARG